MSAGAAPVLCYVAAPRHGISRNDLICYLITLRDSVGELGYQPTDAIMIFLAEQLIRYEAYV